MVPISKLSNHHRLPLVYILGLSERGFSWKHSRTHFGSLTFKDNILSYFFSGVRSETLGVAAGWEPRSPALKAPTQNSLLHHLIAPNISQIFLKYLSKISNIHKSTHPKLSCITSLLPLYLKNFKYFFQTSQPFIKASQNFLFRCLNQCSSS